MYGTFSGNPTIKWITDSGLGGCSMRLLEDFWYDDPEGRRWVAPAGSVVTSASIPRPLWNSVGCQYTDDYRRASIVHSVACNDAQLQRKNVDKMFYYACLAGGCSLVQAMLLYVGVRVGVWAEEQFPRKTFSGNKVLFQIPERSKISEMKIELKFVEIARELKMLGDTAKFEDVEAIVENHLWPRSERTGMFVPYVSPLPGVGQQTMGA